MQLKALAPDPTRYPINVRAVSLTYCTGKDVFFIKLIGILPV